MGYFLYGFSYNYFLYFYYFFLTQLWGFPFLGSIENNIISVLLILGVSILFLIVFKVSSAVIRHSSTRDIAKILLSTFSIFTALVIINVLWKYETNKTIIHIPTLIFYILLLFINLSLFRFYVKFAFVLFNKIKNEKRREKVLIFGTDSDAVGLGSVIAENTNSVFNLCGFISTKNSQQQGRILGCKIYNFNQLKILKKKPKIFILL